MTIRGFHFYLALAGLLLLSSAVFSQSSDPQESQFGHELLVFLTCFVLIVGWIIQLLMVRVKLRELDHSNDPAKANFSSRLPYWFTPHRWAFVLVVILFPVGLSFVSRILPVEDHHFFPALAFQFAASIFVIMITLEVTALYNLTDNEWRPMLTTALSIDLLAFVTFVLLREPKPDETQAAEFMIAFFVLAGVISLVSSFLTLYYARTYEQYCRGELEEVSASAYVNDSQANEDLGEPSGADTQSTDGPHEP